MSGPRGCLLWGEGGLLLGGGVSGPGGVSAPGGGGCLVRRVSAPGGWVGGEGWCAWSGGGQGVCVPGPGGSAPRGGVCIPACTEADTLPPPVDRILDTRL